MPDHLLARGFDAIATGHYAQIHRNDGEARLFRSVDGDKDQTYFIHTVSSDLLEKIVFPVGDLTKQQVRSLAARAGLPAAAKKDSTGLCFLGNVTMKDFLSAYLPMTPGEVRLPNGTVVGEHDGAWFYTLGQRHGFRTAVQTPLVVVRTDVHGNVLIVDTAPDNAAKHTFHLTDTVIRRLPPGPLLARYRHQGALHCVSVTSGAGEIRFDRPQLIAPGQSVVLYADDGECLGGGAVCG